MNSNRLSADLAQSGKLIRVWSEETVSHHDLLRSFIGLLRRDNAAEEVPARGRHGLLHPRVGRATTNATHEAIHAGWTRTHSEALHPGGGRFMRIIQASTVAELVSVRLGMPGNFFDSLEGMAEFARHVASFDCPCSERHLIGSLTRLLLPQYSDGDTRQSLDLVREQAEKLVEGLLDYGDLIEVEDADSGSRLIALRAPSACALSKNKVIVLGIVPWGSDSLPVPYRMKRELTGYSTILTVEDSTTALNDLHSSGYVLISETDWRSTARTAQRKAPLGVLHFYGFRSDNAVGHVEGLSVLDSERSVLHYKSRWAATPANDGDFVARRQRKYGNDAWAFVRLRQKEPVALLDLPTRGFAFRACDEAWHLQLAIDYELGHPQRYKSLHSGEWEC